MMNSIFKTVCENLIAISKLDSDNREKNFRLFMSQGYLFLDLTDKQVSKIKTVFKENYPDKFIEYSEPDEHGFTAEIDYLRFR